jgi:hypothetical protein
MNIRTTKLTLAALTAALGFAAQPLQAFDAPKNTLFTVAEPIRIGDRTLAAGTYVIRVVDHVTDLNTLQVTDSDLLTVYTTFQARQRGVLDADLSREGTLTFDEVPGQAHLLRSWNLPNRSFGYDILTSVPKEARTASLVVKGSPLVKASK